MANARYGGCEEQTCSQATEDTKVKHEVPVLCAAAKQYGGSYHAYTAGQHQTPWSLEIEVWSNLNSAKERQLDTHFSLVYHVKNDGKLVSYKGIHGENPCNLTFLVIRKLMSTDVCLEDTNGIHRP